MLLIIDNYDSFTYNLAQYFIELGEEVTVVRNDQTSVDEIATWAPDRIVISPGPKTPAEAGISLETIRRFDGAIPLFGVCLGCQSMAAAFGGKIIAAPSLMHGKVSPIEHDGKGVYATLPSPFDATRYHSLVVDEATLPENLEITSRTPDGVIMGVRSKTTPTEGVQFHPESIISQQGKNILKNFLAFKGA